MIFLTSDTLYGILRKFSLFLHPRNSTLNSYYNTKFKRKCLTIFNLKRLLLSFFLLQFLSNIKIPINELENLTLVNTLNFFARFRLSLWNHLRKVNY